MGERMAIAQEERGAASVETVSPGDFIRQHIREYGILIALIVIVGFFQLRTDGVILMPVNLTNIVLQNSYIVIMAVGMLLVIVSGHIDLSVGSVMGFIGAVAAVLMVTYQVDFVSASIICLLAGALIGAAQGLWVAYFRIPSFIVTLSGMLVSNCLSRLLLAGRSIGPFPPEFQLLASGFIPDLFPGEGVNRFSLLLGVVTAAGLFWMATRARAQSQKYGHADEPLAFFVAK